MKNDDDIHEPKGLPVFRRRFPPLLVLLAGLVILAAGFAYDLLFAGIPYPDPSPDQQAGYIFHRAIANAIQVAGLGVVAAAIALFAAGFLRRGTDR